MHISIIGFKKGGNNRAQMLFIGVLLRVDEVYDYVTSEVNDVVE